MHVMLDLETLGTRPGCAIVSIGACSFDRTGIKETFYQTVRLSSFDKLEIDPDTVTWWMSQSDAARRVFSDPTRELLPVALDRFDGWYRREAEGHAIWAHGATFDQPILAAAYASMMRPTPWGYRDARDTRTLFDLADYKLGTAPGIEHNALDDAIHQAQGVIDAYKKLEIEL